jgi:hypothetical protein
MNFFKKLTDTAAQAQTKLKEVTAMTPKKKEYFYSGGNLTIF